MRSIEDRFNKHFLTGCLNIMNSKLNDVKFDVKNSNCEDAINIINSDGNITSIKYQIHYLMDLI